MESSLTIRIPPQQLKAALDILKKYTFIILGKDQNSDIILIPTGVIRIKSGKGGEGNKWENRRRS